MTTNAFSVAGKSCIVTGAAMGIGLGIAKRLTDDGANVLLVDRDEPALGKAARVLAGAPGKVATLAGDVGDEATAQAAVDRCVRELGTLDVLVNNAGIYPQIPVLKMTAEQFDRVIRVNLRGVFVFSKAAGLQMAKQGRGGKIVNIASIDSLHPSMVGLGAYDASKGGVHMFTESFALEMAPHRVQVNAIAPGAIRTEGASRPLAESGLSEAEMKKMLEQVVQAIPAKRMGEPDDIAKVAVFLASSGSDYMTGALVVVDGGMLLS
jgi:2-deoxy-D-gluconate 3-dehydrogenase